MLFVAQFHFGLRSRNRKLYDFLCASDKNRRLVSYQSVNVQQ